jgi:hypothetical protein
VWKIHRMPIAASAQAEDGRSFRHAKSYGRQSFRKAGKRWRACLMAQSERMKTILTGAGALGSAGRKVAQLAKPAGKPVQDSPLPVANGYDEKDWALGKLWAKSRRSFQAKRLKSAAEFAESEAARAKAIRPAKAGR